MAWIQLEGNKPGTKRQVARALTHEQYRKLDLKLESRMLVTRGWGEEGGLEKGYK
jgi:hypothetical protein